jgi:hypothetical protein
MSKALRIGGVDLRRLAKISAVLSAADPARGCHFPGCFPKTDKIMEIRQNNYELSPENDDVKLKPS